MKLSCPACGSLSSLDALLGNEGAREAVMAALAMPAPLGKLCVQYLGLFRPAQRQLSFDRVANLLNELLPMISEAKIERGGRIWSAPQEYWAMAMTDMLAKRDKLTLPLKGHGYLLEIIVGYSIKAEAKTETQSEARRGGATLVGVVPAAQQRNALLDKPAQPRAAMPEHLRTKTKEPNDST